MLSVARNGLMQPDHFDGCDHRGEEGVHRGDGEELEVVLQIEGGDIYVTHTEQTCGWSQISRKA